MGFWSLLLVASMPIVQVLILSILGVFMATDYLNLLPSSTRKSLNKIVFMVFTPALMFSTLAETVTFEDLVAWWFMPINIGITFLFGGILGWIAVKLLKPKPYLEGLIIATCSSGNLGNLLLIIVPAICNDDGSPFGDHKTCNSMGLSYASFSMAIGGFYIWTFTYQLIRSSGLKHKALQAAEEASKVPNKDLDANGKSPLLETEIEEHVDIVVPSTKSMEEHDTDSRAIVPQESSSKQEKGSTVWGNVVEVLHMILEELLAPPTLSAIVGFVFGAVPWLKNVLIGDSAPLKVIEDSIRLLGDGTIPCITLILGGNLTQGLRNAKLKTTMVIAVLCVRYVFLPILGIGVVKAASGLGFLPEDPLFHYMLMIQFVLPPAMNIGTMTQLFDVGQEECSVLFLWTYLVACVSLTLWSTIFMSILP